MSWTLGEGESAAGSAHYSPDLGWWAERQVKGRRQQAALTIYLV
jgi:hypothetical protein